MSYFLSRERHTRLPLRSQSESARASRSAHFDLLRTYAHQIELSKMKTVGTKLRSLRWSVKAKGGGLEVTKREKTLAKKQRAILQQLQLQPVRGIEKVFIKATGHAHPSTESVPGFSNLNFTPNVVKAVGATGITKPTVIQMLAAPAILSGRHVLCGAETDQLRKEEENEGVVARISRPRAIVLCPSRELASQVLGVAKSLCHHARLRMTGIIGGKRKKFIRESLYNPTDIVVATLGTLQKYLIRGKINLNDLTHLVIDEADTVFDGTFLDELECILRDVKIRTDYPPLSPADDTQIIVVTATVSSELQEKVKKIVPSVRVVTTKSLHKVLPNIKQVFVKVRQDEKADKLVEILKKQSGSDQKTIVFCNSVKSCTWAANHLVVNGIYVAKYHGGIHPVLHGQRPLKDFTNADQNVLVCTDIASRGIDCSKINHVIQFDFPTSVTDYLHRVGRTGRVGSTTHCQATTFMTKKSDIRMALKIEQAAKKKEPIDDKDLVRTAKRKPVSKRSNEQNNT
ncbi:uncharacterized protein [Dysidea avara]|uniref:uncharacterized protein isoform X2 n=1 Tax=Dysidea avara TaxID=196820 RepID=UPI003321F8E9